MSWPKNLAINAWTGEPAPAGRVEKAALAWTLNQPPTRVDQLLKPPAEADPRDWTDSRVGWGLILPERAGLSPKQLATADDAPEPIRELRKQRGDAPVFRYRDATEDRFTFLRNYEKGKDIAVDPRSPEGLSDDALPKYLLIYARPDEIPWEFQYLLNATCAVGRLDLEGKALERYVSALLGGWATAEAKVDRAVVWAVDHGSGDITRLMRDAIAVKVFEDLVADSDLSGKAVFLDGQQGEATAAKLIAALTDQRPALVVTTSHGKTGPLGDLEATRATLGLPVDGQHATLDAQALLAAWQPDGAIWYAHACCSAGADCDRDGKSIFSGLFEPGSDLDTVLQGVAQLKPTTAPLPRALLGAAKPLRAFVGHVEPTFDWTLRRPETGQHLTANIRKALYNNLYRPEPIGLALQDCFSPLGSLSIQYDTAKRSFDRGGGSRATQQMLYSRLSSIDLRSMVILGDPTAILPPLS